jgi:large subunit ribosomal protein L10
LAISREKKEELVATYKEHIVQSDAIVFADYRGISVPQVQSLRNKLRQNDAVCMVVKNRLFAIALQESGRPQPKGMLEGPNAVIFFGEDISTGVKALQEWIKGQEIVAIKGGLLETSVLNADSVGALTDLPTREQALAMLLGTLNAPAGKLVRTLNAPANYLARVINAPVSGLFNVINARVQQMKSEESA